MNHSSCIYGSIFMIHGGFNTEQKKLLDDFAFFDLEKYKWIESRVYFEGHRIDDRHFHYDHRHDSVIGYRQMHTITPVIYDEFY